RPESWLCALLLGVALSLAAILLSAPAEAETPSETRDAPASVVHGIASSGWAPVELPSSPPTGRAAARASAALQLSLAPALRNAVAPPCPTLVHLSFFDRVSYRTTGPPEPA